MLQETYLQRKVLGTGVKILLSDAVKQLCHDQIDFLYQLTSIS